MVRAFAHTLCRDDANFPFSVMPEMVTPGTTLALNLKEVMCQFLYDSRVFYIYF